MDKYFFNMNHFGNEESHESNVLNELAQVTLVGYCKSILEEIEECGLVDVEYLGNALSIAYQYDVNIAPLLEVYQAIVENNL